MNGENPITTVDRAGREHPWIVGLFVLVAWLATLGTYDVYRGHPLRPLGEPMVFLDAHVVTPVVPPGGNLVVSLTGEKRRLCEVVVQPLLIAGRTHLVTELPRHGTIFGVGRDTRERAYRLPAFLAPDCYNLQLLTTYTCPDGVYPVDLPDRLDFAVAAPDASPDAAPPAICPPILVPEA
jgi:hypothetical protein